MARNGGPLMKLSAPVFQLKRCARQMARSEHVPLNVALDRVARAEGFERWSLLSRRLAVQLPPVALLSQMEAGELLLLAGRPGQGKTRLGLQLLLDAVRDGRRAVLFTLEYTEQQARQQIRAVADGEAALCEAIEVVTSDDISAQFMIGYMSGSDAGSVAVVDYLQLLDQQRIKPALSEQVLAIKTFAGQAGVIFGFVSQIDRSFDSGAKPLPDLDDIRLPNQFDLRLFAKACFMHAGEMRLQAIA